MYICMYANCECIHLSIAAICRVICVSSAKLKCNICDAHRSMCVFCNPTECNAKQICEKFQCAQKSWRATNELCGNIVEGICEPAIAWLCHMHCSTYILVCTTIQLQASICFSYSQMCDFKAHLPQPLQYDLFAIQWKCLWNAVPHINDLKVTVA